MCVQKARVDVGLGPAVADIYRNNNNIAIADVVSIRDGHIDDMYLAGVPSDITNTSTAIDRHLASNSEALGH